MVDDDKADALRERAYLIWEREGRPDGLADMHWEMAREELAREELEREGHHILAPPPEPAAQETVAGPSTAEEPPAYAMPRRRRVK